MGAGAAPGQSAPLQAVEQHHEIGALDAERRGHVRLLQSRRMTEQHQHAVLRRPQLQLGEIGDDVVEHGKLGAPQHIAERSCERTHIDRRGALHRLRWLPPARWRQSSCRRWSSCSADSLLQLDIIGHNCYSKLQNNKMGGVDGAAGALGRAAAGLARQSKDVRRRHARGAVACSLSTCCPQPPM